jgi:hypothetical protein
MLAFCGDWHGAFGDGIDRVKPFVDEHNATVIQVGDFGYWPDSTYPEFPFPVYWIDGNHEYFADPKPIFETFHRDAKRGWKVPVDELKPLLEYTEITELRENMFYVPRGTVLELDGYLIGFLGGADSVDQIYRREGISWFREEAIRQQDINKLLDNVAGRKLDILVTHTPPDDLVSIALGFERFRNPKYAISSRAVQGVWEALERPYVFCGHLHVKRQYHNCTILPEFGVQTLLPRKP